MIDGDSLAHRAYHALPKSIRLNGGRSASPTCSLGSGRPSSRARCSSAGTRSRSPTYRHEAFEAYQSGREFEESLLEQLDAAAASSSARSGFAAAKARRLRGRRLPRAPRSPSRRSAAARRSSRPPTATLFQLASERTTILQPVRGVSRARAHRPGGGARALRRRAGAGAGLHRAPRRPLRQAPGRARGRAEEGGGRPAASTARWRTRSPRDGSPRRRRICGSTGESRR